MALAARARGTTSQLLGKAETTIGTAPSGNWARLPIYEYSLGRSRPLVADPIVSQGLGRAPAAPFYDESTFEGAVTFPLDTGNIDFWATLLFGAVVTTGTTLDTYTAGGTPTAASFEDGETSLADYWSHSGVHAKGFQLDFSPAGRAKMTVQLTALSAAAKSGSSIGGTPTTATFAPILNNAAVFKINGTEVGNALSGSLKLDLGLDLIRTVRSSGTGGEPIAVDGGLMAGGFDLTLRNDDSTFDDYAIAGTAKSIDLAFALTGGFALTFTFPTVLIERPSKPITGPGGIESRVTGQAYGASSTTMFKLTRTR